MLNIDLVDKLYAQLPRERQRLLITQLFKQSKQTMAYFRRTKDISLSKLETLADFFQMPLDALRIGSGASAEGVDINNRGSNRVCNTLMTENNALRKEIESLNAQLQSKDETIKAKNETIAMLRENEKMRVILKEIKDNK